MAKTASAKKAAKKVAPPKTAVKKAAKKVAKKTTPLKKTAEKKKPEIKIKYEDKSAGQPELVVIFEAIKKMLQPYDKKRALVLHADKPSQANLVSHKPLVLEGKPRKEFWLVSALVQKGYVGFYCSPAYDEKEMKKYVSEEFIKCLKGGSCYHIKKNDPQLLKDIKKAIELKYALCIEKGII